MAEAMFSDQSGDPAGQFMRGAEFGQNFMQRRQRQTWEAEDRSQTEQMRQLTQPVYQAQLQAQMATAKSSLQTFTQQEQLRTRFAQEAPAFNAKYQEAMKLPTFEAQQSALAQLQPQITWMGLLPEGKGFVDTVNMSRTLAFQSTVADKKIQGTIEEINARNVATKEQIVLRNQGDMDVAKLRGSGTTADQRLFENLERARASGDQEEIAFYEGRRNRLSSLPSNPADQASAYRSQAAQYAATDPQRAKDLNALADKLTGQSTSGFTPESFAAAIANFGRPTSGTTSPPVPGKPVVTPPPVPSGTTTTTTIVKDPGFSW